MAFQCARQILHLWPQLETDARRLHVRKGETWGIRVVSVKSQMNTRNSRSARAGSNSGCAATEAQT